DEEKANFAYAPGKWTIKEILLHLTDSERVLSYRAMAFARGELQALPGFDQDTYVHNSQAQKRTLQSILAEFEAVRKATIALFENLPTETLTLIGNANNFPTSVRGLAAMIAGHEIHHTKQIQTKYL
ncbi:MAG: DinB family protein, partial [Raineya sp.]|nr:DinB family protein [Raineya sp.]